MGVIEQIRIQETQKFVTAAVNTRVALRAALDEERLAEPPAASVDTQYVPMLEPAEA